MLSLRSLVSYIIILVTLIQVVHSRPWLVSSVELRACGTEPSPPAMLDECNSICAPISRAQEICASSTLCTCAIAPPSALSLCLECHISRRDGLESQWISATVNARESA
ncbi:hypothetical protein BDY19DRAFT_994881 [Irpex rosettiformis]|uniref:Uncharacterized protein n=1 Tax=Irpex rosettiformis TaxID=378272 RepID=A0ACB8U0N3_9APHY|nr:hypothetical protein BDY19DRAFT_994881 [Irpex rosettiformis]